MMSIEPAVLAAFQDCEFAAGNLTRRYRLLRPDLKPGETAPLLVFLHGAGERGDDNEAQLKYLPEHLASPEIRERYKAFVLAPQCREESSWVDAIWGETKSRAMADAPTDDLRWVMQLIEHLLVAEPVDKGRIYLTGLSMGGYGAWELACRWPHLFAALAPICGGGDETQAASLVDLPIWAWHGAKDDAVPVERSRHLVDAIQNAGGQKCRYTELAGEGHKSWIPAYRPESGLLDWMFSIAKSPLKT
jgi:predicted peptidase